MRILVVEDHSETRRMVERMLKDAGYTPEGTVDLAGARKKLASGKYGAIVLDWMLPDGAGIELCREMRAGGDATPVLILTARGEVEDRVRGLDAGADDYLRKPFAVAELLARMRALMRRGPRFDAPVVMLEDLEIRLTERRVLIRGQDVPVTAREFAILEMLLRRRGQAVSRTDILETVWGQDSESSESSLEVLIGRLRRKLAGGAGDGIIRTHRGFGYSIGYTE
ncbi:MAG TPA: response regulator transcription factor [Patescibacteria group bacterium]|nr:response regulator transcription factor [Patescibacteria group bacterium]